MFQENMKEEKVITRFLVVKEKSNITDISQWQTTVFNSSLHVQSNSFSE